MGASLYAEFSLFCIVLLGAVSYKMRAGLKTDTTWTYFSDMVVTLIGAAILDLMWEFVLLDVISVPPFTFFIITCVFYLFANVATYRWFMFSENIQNSSMLRVRRHRIYIALPFIVVTALSVVSQWTHWMYYVDSSGVYHRGPLFFLQSLIIIGFIGFTGVAALKRAFEKKNYIDRGRFLSISLFSVFPLTFVILQWSSTTLPSFTAGATLAVIFVFFFFQDQLISTDSLTKINNRNMMLRYLDTKMNARDPKKCLVLFMMDIDNFKQINDKNGHIHGDAALEITAAMLKKIAAKNNCFIARFGGDEFIIGEFESYDKSQRVIDDINAFVKHRNENSLTPYKITYSIGAAELTPDIQYVPDFIEKADAALYEIKAAKKLKR